MTASSQNRLQAIKEVNRMKQYGAIELEVIRFEDADIITTSGDTETPILQLNG